MVFRGFGTGSGKLQEHQSFRDEFLVPLRSVLLKQRIQITGFVDAGRKASGVETHQGGERICGGGFRERVFQQDRGEPHSLAAESSMYRRVRRCTVVTLVEQ